MKIIITGGLGFIGSNAVKYFSSKGDEVVVIDNMSRCGASRNLEWLKTNSAFSLIKEDIRNRENIKNIFAQHSDVDVVIHLAAQVAVTTSVLEPLEDFEINAAGTLNILEAIRTLKLDPVIIYSSTNKVYGSLDNVEIEECEDRYTITPPEGISETQPLDFHSPYGCSKGVADQYVRDYARIYKLRTVTLRQSCIYGERQFGIEDQGWVAWFIIAISTGQPITVYGDGKQVRDILNVDDLVACYDSCIKNIDSISGEVFNIGGGHKNSVSIINFIKVLEECFARPIEYLNSETRPGDQAIFISNNQKAKQRLGWAPKVGFLEGIDNMFTWVEKNKAVFALALAQVKA